MIKKTIKIIIIILASAVVIWYLAIPTFVMLSLLPQISPPPINYVTASADKSTLTITRGQLTIPLDVYTPKRANRKTLVVIHAANEKGKDDPRIQNLATVFARAGFDTYAPTLAHLNRQTFHPLAIEEITEAVNYAKTAKPEQPLTVITFSLSAGPALIAAGQDETRGQIQKLVLFGGYFDIDNVIKFNTTGPETRDPFGIWLFARYYAQFLPENDAKLFYEIAERKWKDPDANITDLAAKLGPGGKGALALLENRDPEQVTKLIGELPNELKTFMQTMDPEPWLSRIEASVVLLHSKNDVIVPFQESEKLAAALRDRQKQVKFIELNIFDHVNPVLPELSVKSFFFDYVPEFWRLYQASWNILRKD